MGEVKHRSDSEMVDSGVEWLGEIPRDWVVKRLKHVLSEPLKYGANESAELDDKSLPRYIRITDFGNDGKLRDNTFKSLEYEKAVNYMLKEGDILFARSGATVGKTFQFKGYKGKACFAGYLIKAVVNKTTVKSDFLYYFTKSLNYENWKNSIFIQATIQNIGADKYQELKLLIPKINEQQKITNFLDIKTAELDRVIAKKEELITKLEEAKKSLISEVVTGKSKIVDGKLVSRDDSEMKDSGVEWLDNVPKEWNIKAFKHSFKVRNGREIVDETKNISKPIPVYGSGGTFKYTSKFLYNGESVLFGRKGTIGKPLYIKEKFWTVDTMYYTTFNKDSFPKFFYYQLLVFPWHIITTSTALPSIVGNDIENIKTTTPKLNEMRSISYYLDIYTDNINDIISKINNQIQKLKAAKQSLISEAVTGKIDLRDWQIIEEGERE